MLLAHISVTASLKREAAMALSKWDFGIGRDIDGGLGHVLSNQTATFIVLVVPSSIIAVLGGVGLWVWGPVNQTLSGVFVGVVSASVTVILTLILLSIIYYIARKKNHYKFIEFFGTVTTQTRGALLLFAGRRLVNPSEVKWDIKTKIPEIDAAKPKGVSDWFPVQDLRGANYVAGELAKHTNQTAYYRTDADLLSDPIDQIRATVFSFGLGFNQFTHRLAACTEGKLFNVKIADGTDQISIPGMGLLKPHLGIDYSIVVRIAHAPASPTRYYFLCAGRTANGTAVAGKFLATRWKDMLQMYEKDRKNLQSNSLLLVICHRSLNSSDPNQGEDDHGEIAKANSNEPFRLWWPRPDAGRDVGIVHTPESSAPAHGWE